MVGCSSVVCLCRVLNLCCGSVKFWCCLVRLVVFFLRLLGLLVCLGVLRNLMVLLGVID